jgi:Tfp pilus assembly protein PilN
MVAAAPGSFFCRSIPAGGLAITTAISKDIHAPLEEAEQLKVTRGSVGLGPGFEPPADPVEANLAKISRQALIKTQADISRSISYYRSNLGGPDVSRLLLSGGVAAMPYFAEFLQEKFQKEIGFLNTLEGISTTADGAAFAEANPHNLAELIGGALAVVPQQHTSVNLLPPSISKRQEFSKRFPYLAAAAALFLLTISTWWFYAVSATQATDAESAKITIDIQTKKETSAKLSDLLEKEKAIAKKSAELRDLVVLKEAYPRILTELAAKVPERFLWITEIQPASGESSLAPAGAPSPTGQKIVEGPVSAIIVKGLYLDNPRQAAVVDDFVTALQSSDVFVVEEKDKSKIITQRSSPSGEYWAYPFALRIPLRTPITQLP